MEKAIRFENNAITSRQNPYIQYVCKLAEKKHRQKERRFRLDGIKLFVEAINSEVEIEAILISDGAKDKIISGFEDFLTIAIERGTDIKLVSDGVFEKISEEKSPEGIVCIAKYIDKFHKIATIDNIRNIFENNLEDSDRIFALESIRDPGNLGTIVRSAVAFGTNILLISSDCADIYNSKTIRAAMGTLFKQRIIIVDDMVGALKILSEKGRRLFAATLSKDSKLLGQIDFLSTDCIVVGNEGHGLSREVISACDETLLIPMTPSAESLNAAIASSVCLWEQFGRNL